jgi:hypothetical protein
VPELLPALGAVHQALGYLSEKNANPLRPDVTAQLEPVRAQLRAVVQQLGALAAWQSEGPPA